MRSLSDLRIGGSPSASLVLVCAMMGCGGPTTPVPTEPTVLPTTGTPVVPSPPTEADPCASFDATAPSLVGAFQEATVLTTGGIGPFQFSIVGDESGGVLQASSGTYLAGSEPGMVSIEVEDIGCSASIEIGFEVVEEFVAVPENARVEPGQSVVLSAMGGTGAVTCAPVDLGVDGALNGCVYTAGTVLETHRIEVSDPATGVSVDVDLEVVPASAPGRALLDYTSVLLPVGVDVDLGAVRGSGQLSFPSLPPGLSFVDDRLSASEVIDTDVVVVDEAVGVEQTIRVVSSAPLGFEQNRMGTLGEWARTVRADLDSDGFEDLVFTQADGSYDALRGGAVLIYPGTASGYESDPVVLAGDTDGALFGRGVAVGDLDGDGLLELLVGASSHPGGGSVRGRVFVYSGRQGGFPMDLMATMDGGFNSDQLGYALASCDLNGDGYDDVIAGVPGAEDRSVVPAVANAGGIEVFLGGPQGPSTQRDAQWFSRRPELVDGEWVWVEATSAVAGTALDVGDIDGDGGCDVVIGGFTGTVAQATGTSGGVWVVDSEEVLQGGLPRQVIGEPTVGNARLGRQVRLGDVDGDGRDDVLTTARLAASGAGEAYVFPSTTFDVTPLFTRDDATVVLQGNNPSDAFGFDMSWSPDTGGMVVGAPLDEITSGPGGVGVVHHFTSAQLYDGTSWGGLLIADDLSAVATGATSVDFYGMTATALGDPDGDGVPDILSFAPRENNLGVRDGALYLEQVSGPTEMVLPSRPAGLGFGTSVAWTDEGELKIGAPGYARPPNTPSVGGFFEFRDDVLSAETGQVPPSLGSNSRNGQRMERVGDLDGDGFDEYATGNEFALRLANLANAYNVPDACVTTRNLGAAGLVAVYRGTADGVADQPSWAFYGEAASDQMAFFAGNMDFDGDGFTDLAIGGHAFGPASYGGQAKLLLSGGAPWTAPPDGQIDVRCDGVSYRNDNSNSWFGRQLTPLGDLDQDGCDELAIASPFDDIGGTNSGSVRVLWGHGAPTCGQPRLTSVRVQETGAALGRILHGGVDLDGDSIPDLLAGNPNYLSGPGAVGSVWFIPGSSLLAGAVPFDGTFPNAGTFVEPVDQRVGTDLGEQYGGTLSTIGGRAVVSSHRALNDGRPLGRVEVWTMAPTGFSQLETVAFGDGPVSDFGLGLASHPDPVFAIGAPLSDALNLDSGAVYQFDLR